MSASRRTSGDIHILAMLDGRAGGRRLRARPALLWYGAGGMLACALLAMLAWLVRGSAPARDAAPAAMAAAAPAAPATTVSASLPAPQSGTRADVAPVLAGQDALPGPSAAVLPSTAIVEVDSVASAASSASAAATASAPLAVPATPVHPLPLRRGTARPVPSRGAPQSAVPALSPAHADARPARHKRNPATVRSPAPASVNVDTDVAVISAILQHTGTDGGADTAAAAPTASCAERSCGPRMPSR